MQTGLVAHPRGAIVRCVRVVKVRDELGEPIMDDAGQPLLRACPNPTMYGLSTCSRHTGAERRRQSKELQFLSRSSGLKVADLLVETHVEAQHPLDGLLEAQGRAGELMRVIGSLVGELDLEPGSYRWETDAESGEAVLRCDSGIYGLDHNEDGAPHVLVQMYGAWLDRFVKTCKLIIDADLDERMVRNAEATTGVLLQALLKAGADVGLPPEWQAALNASLARILRESAGLPVIEVEESTT